MSITKWIVKFVILTLGIAIAPPTALAGDCFNDVDSGDTHYVAICNLKETGVIDGYPDNTFRASDKINRAEALKMITLANNFFTEDQTTEAAAVEEDPFSDTPASAWYSGYLQKAKDAGIISGYGDGTFKPEQTINLVETLKIYLESSQDPIYPNPEEYILFEDTPVSAWFTKYVAYAAARSVLNISPSNEVFPDQEITRGYLAEILYRFKAWEYGYEFGKTTWYGNAVAGNNTASGEIFDPEQLTAAHKTLPFGTIVEVTNLANGKTVQVKITDRGPYGPGRVLDLSSAAFSEIAWLGTGVIYTQNRIISTP